MSDEHLVQLGLTIPPHCVGCDFLKRGVCMINPMGFTLTDECPKEIK